MKLSAEHINDAFWAEHGYQCPQFDVAAAASEAQKAPVWLHFGAGNIFRAFLGNLWQRLLNEGAVKSGLIVAEGFDEEIIERVYRPHDNLSVFVRLLANGESEKILLASISEGWRLNPEQQEDFNRLLEIAAAPTLQMMSLTITEKGYVITDRAGNYFPDVAADLQDAHAPAKSYIGKIIALLRHRYRQGAHPIALVSMDNMAHNGEKLENVVMQFAEAQQADADEKDGFLNWLRSDKVSFPWTMIDKITPRPDESICQQLIADGIEDIAPRVTQKNTYIAPFVNAESAEYLVIEDNFPNGRPPLDKVGVLFADRQTVNQVETMKVTTCLNPIHTALAVFGCLLGYTSIHAEMKDADLLALAKQVGYQEGLPVVVDPKILNPKAFIDEVINERLPNPFIPDTPQRIASDTSQKLSVRFGETLKAWQARGNDLSELTAIPLVFAAWCRYLLGVDDQGNTFTSSPDPKLEALQAHLQGVRLGEEALGDVRAILSDSTIFGVDLYAVGLGEKVEQLLKAMLKGAGAVRRTLHTELAKAEA